MKFKSVISVLFIMLIFTLVACNKDESNDPVDNQQPVVKNVASCEGCHTNYDKLKAVYTPDPPSDGEASHGCGGEAPHYEPYDRVYLAGEGYTEFKKDVHGKIPCVSCHNGVDKTADKAVAHSGNFLKKPSLNSEEKCASCHTDIHLNAKNSLHAKGWGQKSMVALRSGKQNIPEGFDQLSHEMIEGYDKNCGKCHANCGDCHVLRPSAGGGGLYKGHQFVKTPDMRDHCVTCHSSRGGHAYFGQAVGTQPDVHLEKRQFTCLNCHDKNELHGDGKIYDQRYKLPSLPKCTDCHASVANSNNYHKTHMNTFSCNTCHSQDYNNCGSCHVGGEGARIASYQGYKIGLNPIPETKNFKYAVMRRSLMAPDSWKNYGVPVLSNFDAKPTYKYATPHNIQKWTARTKTDAGKACYDNCHISKNADGTYKNKEIYLFTNDLEQWEKGATSKYTVDGKLPSAWNVK